MGNVNAGEIGIKGKAIICEPSKCIKCTKCVVACDRVGFNFLSLKEPTPDGKIGYTSDMTKDCTYCGHCTLACPVDAIREVPHLEEVKKALEDPEKIVIVQSAPSIRASICEEFKMGLGINGEKKLNTAYRKLGFDKVFDVNFGADITTMVEAEELVDRLNHDGEMGIGKVLPMFTSCCRSWVKYVEFAHPDIIPNLTTSRSPHIHSGGAYKTWWAERNNIDPKNIVVVSIMPCTSKKYEASLERFNINGMKPVDYVLTTRETAALIKEKGIDFPNLEESDLDAAGNYSGAGAIYGASGGVMESALRTAYKMIVGENIPNFDLTEVRTDEGGFRTAEIDIKGRKIRVAVVSGVRNMERVIAELRENPDAYQYIEVMSCPGGCIGGGGQPKYKGKVPADLVPQRASVLYGIDRTKSLRTAHDNPMVQEFFSWLKAKEDQKFEHDLLHTFYQKQNRID